MEVWFTENQTPGLRISCRVADVLHRERSDFQEVLMLETNQFGRMLVLDDVIQTTEKDEFTYHELMAHVPLLTHPDPRRVLVVGGGDGGVIREILKHPGVELARLVEIDRAVVEVSRRLLPGLSRGLDDPRAEVVIADGIGHVAAATDEYDVIIVDSTDPIGAAVGLFTADFYRSVHSALRKDGLFVAQTESPFFNRDLIAGIQRSLRDIFALNRLYWGVVPTYPGGCWTFSMGSKGPDPLEISVESVAERLTAAGEGHPGGRFPARYITPGVYRATFALPTFIEELLPPRQG